MRRFTLLLWIAFIVRGVLHALVAPMWDGFDEPFHLAYVEFVAEHGRPPRFNEASFPRYYVTANTMLPSGVGYDAPTFTQWRAMSDSEREILRSRAVATTKNMSRAGRRDYYGANYERQQGPVFYYLAAPLELVTRSWSLPARVVVMRIFCVLMASLVVPLSARLLSLTLGRFAVYSMLPLLALLPNTLFFVDRITNDALAWPLFTAALLYLALAVREGSAMRNVVIAAVTIAFGIWTKLTLLPLLFGAAVVAVMLFRRGHRQAGALLVAIPMIGAAAFFVWTQAESGTWTGLAEANAPMAGHLGAGIAFVTSSNYWLKLISTHFWSGGWGFVQPPASVYLAALGLFVAALLMLSRHRQEGGERRDRFIFVTIAAAFLAAMIVHAFKGAVMKAQQPTFPTIGAEGWYFDLLRPIEAYALAAIVGAVRWRTAGLVALIGCVITDVAGTTTLLYPYWSGGVAGLTFDFSPMNVPVEVVGFLVALFVALLGSAAGTIARAAEETAAK